MTQHTYQVTQYFKHTVSLNKAKIIYSITDKFLQEKGTKKNYS